MVRLEFMMVSKPQVCLGSKSQSPSTLGWRLGVEVRHTRRFEIAFTLGTRFGLMDSRRYRRGRTPSSHYVDAHGQLPDEKPCYLWKKTLV
jgi:hypothetical protein